MIFGHQAAGQNGGSDNQQPTAGPSGGSYIVGAQATDASSFTPASDNTSTPPALAPQDDVSALAPPDELGLGAADSHAEPDVIQQDSPLPVTTSPTDDATAPSIPDSDLLALKQQALSDLGPLINQLDQTPEERFRTTMMMLQSTDNQTLIKEAYAAAQKITDEKARAQALLDVVNEINYFTQQTAKN